MWNIFFKFLPVPDSCKKTLKKMFWQETTLKHIEILFHHFYSFKIFSFGYSAVNNNINNRVNERKAFNKVCSDCSLNLSFLLTVFFCVCESQKYLRNLISLGAEAIINLCLNAPPLTHILTGVDNLNWCDKQQLNLILAHQNVIFCFHTCALTTTRITFWLWLRQNLV